MNALCVDGSMSVHEWLGIAESLDVEGVEGVISLSNIGGGEYFSEDLTDSKLLISCPVKNIENIEPTRVNCAAIPRFLTLDS